ncbi:HAD family hydrolase [Deinococcus humi]|uniref:HAD superfamily hydrolase (TIGR01509 family) n=1 Tax=Deinococcus humi TaxID=662880 RepID=A0A7W8JSJ3_9DEIO|nr:HAD-IA family hydrolase [Deinococcus humi]MBB5360986.1 HAD superfamily hydrolase (TIGR01509 family) [Deinococcus humi]GGO17922.1 beta-phosphoglucomutase [Deinococcus humi]
MPQFDAILFDLDGVLVDSELQANTVWVQLLAEQGLDIDLPTFMANAVGGTHVVLFEWLKNSYGWTRPETFVPELDARLHEAFGSTQAIEGAARTLALLREAGLPFAVASNSLRSRLKRKLEASGLAPLVGEHAYDPAHVGGRGKPAPDLYAYAAAQLGADITRCLVIEDSVTGLSAGVAAGATAWGLLAGGHVHPDNAAHLTGAGAKRILRTHKELQGALGLVGASLTQPG